MRLPEFQAKAIFRQYGIPIPQGELITNDTDLSRLTFPKVLKAQVASGGRGKAGGVKVVKDREEAERVTGAMLQSKLQGDLTQVLLAEDFLDIEHELFLSLLIDRYRSTPLLLASAYGGVDIEDVARKNPDRIFKQHIDPSVGLRDYMVRFIARGLGVGNTSQLRDILDAMLRIHMSLDATTVEINPLAKTASGLIAADAKVVLDDKAAFRHAELYQNLKTEQERYSGSDRTPAETLAELNGVTYVPLDGDIGVISDGAGTGMLVIDLLSDLGGQPANFCEMGGLADAEYMYGAMDVVLSNPRVRVLMVALIGGLTRMDHMGEGIAQYLREKGVKVPTVIRMCGTREETGKDILRQIGLDTFDDLNEAARKAVELAREA